jgi:hypothetical protein
MSQFKFCFHAVVHLQLLIITTLRFLTGSTITTCRLPQDNFHFSLNAPFSSPTTPQYLTPSIDPQKTACFSLVIHSTRKELLSFSFVIIPFTTFFTYPPPGQFLFKYIELSWPDWTITTYTAVAVHCDSLLLSRG